MANKTDMKVAIVTGGSRGIGSAIAGDMLDHGFITCIISTGGREKYKSNLEALEKKGEVFYYQGSIASAEDRNGFVDAIIEKYSRIDVLVNNAGVAPRERRDILETTEDSFDFVVGTNLRGTMFLTQRVSNEMIALNRANPGRSGIIVNISSFSATVASTNRAEYCVSKAGVSMLTKLYASRLAGEGILVYEVQPGVITTDMTKNVSEKYNKLIYAPDGAFPIKRWGEPQDVARVVSVLVNGGLTYSTGQVIYCDGGYMNVRSI